MFSAKAVKEHWNKYKRRIEYGKNYKIIDGVLIIDKGRTEIGNHEFSGFEIKKVIIPEGVTKIGYWGFGVCKKLENVVLPSSLESVEREAFAMCPIKDIVFTDGCPHLYT